eukprot:2528298-Prymnesium_polylepis.1
MAGVRFVRRVPVFSCERRNGVRTRPPPHRPVSRRGFAAACGGRVCACGVTAERGGGVRVVGGSSHEEGNQPTRRLFHLVCVCHALYTTKRGALERRCAVVERQEAARRTHAARVNAMNTGWPNRQYIRLGDRREARAIQRWRRRQHEGRRRGELGGQRRSPPSWRELGGQRGSPPDCRAAAESPAA